jgi:hypothetical protein
VFNAQETAPGGRLMRTIGIVRAHVKIGLENFVYNPTLERMAAALPAGVDFSDRNQPPGCGIRCPTCSSALEPKA